MCPACLAASALYVVIGGVSAGAVTTFFATKLVRKRPEPTASSPSTETERDNMDANEMREKDNDRSQDRNT